MSPYNDRFRKCDAKHISWSAYNTFKTCGLQYKLRQIDKVKLPIDQRNFLVGATVANMIPDWQMKGQWEQGWLVRNYVRYFQDYLKEIEGKRNQYVRWKELVENTKVKEGVTSDLEHNLFRIRNGVERVEEIIFALGFNKRPVSIEGNFDLPVPNAPGWHMRGGWDFYDRQEGVVYDLKMTEGEGYESDQLLIYAMAIMLLEKVRLNKVAFIYPYKSNPVVYHSVRDSDIRDAYVLLHRAIKDIDAGERLTASPGSQCYGCEFFKTIHCTANPSPTVPIVGTHRSGAKIFSFGSD